MVYLVYYYIYLYIILLLYIYVQLYSKIKNIYLAAHGLLLPWKPAPVGKLYGITQAERRTLSGWRTAGKAGSFLLDVCRSRWFYRCGILRPYKPAQNGQKQRCDGADSRTRERVWESRSTMRMALKRE